MPSSPDVSPEAEPSELAKEDFPDLYHLADTVSTMGRDSTFWQTRWYLIALTVGALAGAVSWKIGSQDLMGWVSVVAFLLSSGLTLRLALRKPAESWYQGRAAAESVKSLTWCYVTRADPFPDGAADVDQAFIDRLRQIVRELSHLDATVTTGEQITNAMRELRSAAFTTRREAYVTGRIEEQRKWYADKVAFHRRRARQLMWGAALSSIVGLVLGMLRAQDVISIDLLGLCATIGAALVAESQLRQHSINASAYALASQELGMASALARNAEEEAWPRVVGEAEEAISREHNRRDRVSQESLLRIKDRANVRARAEQGHELMSRVPFCLNCRDDLLVRADLHTSEDRGAL